MIIDFHAHIYPEKIATKATQAIGDFYNTSMTYNGSIIELLNSGKKIGVEKYIVHSTATKAEQVESINNFIIGEVQAHPEFIGFGTIHPDYKNFENELDRIYKANLKGIKIHPDFQKFLIDDEKAYKIKATASSMATIPRTVVVRGPRVLFSRKTSVVAAGAVAEEIEPRIKPSARDVLISFVNR